MKRNWLVFCISAAVISFMLASFLAGCGDDNSVNGGEEKAPEAVVEKTDSSSIDACGIVTQQDATKLFGQSAKKDESGALVVDPNMAGECLWSYDTETSSQLIQFRIWSGEQYYAPTADSQAFEIGEKGAIRVNSFAGVDIEWVQDGNTINLSYFTTGSDVPDATTKVDEVKALARQASEKL